MNKTRKRAIKMFWKLAKEKCPFQTEEIVNGYLEGFIDCAEYLLLQNTELEKENALLKGRNEGFELQIMGLLIKYEEVYKHFPDLKSVMDKAKAILKENTTLKERNANLEEKISILLSCKNCTENKGGLLCQKEYEDKCLAQKIQYIKELKEEIAELEKELEQSKKVQVVEHFEAYGQCRDSRRIAILEAENAELKADNDARKFAIAMSVFGILL